MKILIATDGSAYSRAAVRECCRMVIRAETADILIISVFEETYGLTAEPIFAEAEYYHRLRSWEKATATAYVEKAKKIILDRFKDNGLKISTEILQGSPDQQIIERADEWKADLIVVGSHGRGFWGRLLGSVSDGVVHHAHCPVLVVRKPGISTMEKKNGNHAG